VHRAVSSPESSEAQVLVTQKAAAGRTATSSVSAPQRANPTRGAAVRLLVFTERIEHQATGLCYGPSDENVRGASLVADQVCDLRTALQSTCASVVGVQWVLALRAGRDDVLAVPVLPEKKEVVFSRPKHRFAVYELTHPADLAAERPNQVFGLQLSIERLLDLNPGVGDDPAPGAHILPAAVGLEWSAEEDAVAAGGELRERDRECGGRVRFLRVNRQS
jgi:hypothetical protein